MTWLRVSFITLTVAISVGASAVAANGAALAAHPDNFPAARANVGSPTLTPTDALEDSDPHLAFCMSLTPEERALLGDFCKIDPVTDPGTPELYRNPVDPVLS